MEYTTIGNRQYLRISEFAKAINISEATVYNWRRAGHLEFEKPLGRTLTFVSRETVERLMRLRITAEMGAFIKEKVA